MSGPVRPAAIPVFGQVRAVVTAGPHAVARFPGILLVVRGDGTLGPEAVGELLQLGREVSEASPRAPGRTLARRLTGWLARTEDAPGVGALSATDDGLAVFLFGAVSAQLPDGLLEGRRAAFTVDRLLDWPDHPVRLWADGCPPGDGPGPAWADLQRGAVTGGGLVLHAGGPTSRWPDVSTPAVPGPATVDPDPDRSPAPPPPDPEVGGPPLVIAAPAVSDRIAGVAPDEAPRAPLPLLSGPPRSEEHTSELQSRL